MGEYKRRLASFEAMTGEQQDNELVEMSRRSLAWDAVKQITEQRGHDVLVGPTRRNERRRQRTRTYG
jgi:hypothetical protein